MKTVELSIIFTAQPRNKKVRTIHIYKRKRVIRGAKNIRKFCLLSGLKKVQGRTSIYRINTILKHKLNIHNA